MYLCTLSMYMSEHALRSAIHAGCTPTAGEQGEVRLLQAELALQEGVADALAACQAELTEARMAIAQQEERLQVGGPAPVTCLPALWTLLCLPAICMRASTLIGSEGLPSCMLPRCCHAACCTT